MKCCRDGLLISSCVNATNSDNINIFNRKTALSFSGISSACVGAYKESIENVNDWINYITGD